MWSTVPLVKLTKLIQKTIICIGLRLAKILLTSPEEQEKHREETEKPTTKIKIQTKPFIKTKSTKGRQYYPAYIKEKLEELRKKGLPATKIIRILSGDINAVNPIGKPGRSISSFGTLITNIDNNKIDLEKTGKLSEILK